LAGSNQICYNSIIMILKNKIKKFKIWVILVFLFLATPVLAFTPNDPLYPEQIYLKQIKADAAWDIASGQGTIVAVLDSGVDINNPDLKGNIWTDPIDNSLHGWDFVTNTSDPSPKAGSSSTIEGLDHGTAIAGIISATANNNEGMAGVAWNAKIMPIRVLDGTGEGDLENVIKAVKYAVNHGTDIINLSLVGSDKSGEFERILNWARREGVVVVASAGNTTIPESNANLNATPAYPACYSSVLGVASVDNFDHKSDFSNYGSNCIGISAPGENLVGLSHDKLADYYLSGLAGTSFSTALVSGGVALVKSKNENLFPSQIISILKNSADDIDAQNSNYQKQLGAGRLNLLSAVSASAPDLNRGYLIKLKNDKAVYFVGQDNRRHLFPNEDVYWSWFSGNWSNQNIKVVSENDFDILTLGDNVGIRSGSYLIKFSGSSAVYAVVDNKFLKPLTSQFFSLLYQKRPVITLPAILQSDYEAGVPLVDLSYPDGTILQYINSSDVYYIEDGKKRWVSGDVFAFNNFKASFIVKNVPIDMVYFDSSPLKKWEELVQY